MSLRALFARRPRLAPPPPFPEPFVPEETATVPVEEARRVLAGLAELRREHAQIPQRLAHSWEERSDWIPQDQRFDANRYFAAFDRLRPDDGWVLDYVYHYWGNGGSPFLYPRRRDEPPLTSVEQYRERFPGGDHPSVHLWLWRLAAERSPEGAFQLALFALEGEKFYLHWHSNYFDTELVCTPERREEILASIPDEHPGPSLIDGITPEERERLRAYDLAPVVRRAGDFAEVEALAFTKWGGFHRRTTRIVWPNRVLGERGEEVVSYQCGIMF